MSRSLLVSRRAEADLREIWIWTCQHFGERQADQYLELLEASLVQCSELPESGADRSDLRQGYRSRSHENHVAFYTYDAQAVVIQRILHVKMDVAQHLEEESS